jgi:hypothetical protein
MYPVLPCPALSCILSCPALPESYPALPCPTYPIFYPALPCPTYPIFYPALPCHILHPALPCPALPCFFVIGKKSIKEKVYAALFIGGDGRGVGVDEKDRAGNFAELMQCLDRIFQSISKDKRSK